MGDIIDLTDGQDHQILSATESEGLLGGSYLDGQPLGEYLGPDEQPKYVIRNKKSGVLVNGSDSQTLEPDGDFQAFGLVTDLRVIFVVGQHGGDRAESIQLADIVEASVDSSLRTSTLSVETLDDEIWEFSSTDDLTPVGRYIEEIAQVWANAARLLDDLEDSLGRAANHLDDGNSDDAQQLIDGAQETITTAEHRITEVGPGARARIEARASDLRTRLTALERELTGKAAASAHSRAQSQWDANEYEAAATAYDEAIEAYQSALDLDGSVPDTASLQSRLRGVAAERELLRVGPLIDADTSRRRAVALADSEKAASEWERALDRYHDLLGVDWGNADGTFVADRDLIREQTTEIADDAITDHYEAGRQWLRSGDKLAVQDRQRQATQVYERAAEQFEHARRLAKEIRPGRLDRIDEAIAAAETRLGGTHPTDTVPDDSIAFDPADTPDDGSASVSETSGETDEIEGLSFHDSASTATQSTQSAGETDPVEPSPIDTDGSASESVLDQIQAQKQTHRSSQQSRSDDEADATTDEDASEPIPAAELRERLQALDTAELRAVVARLWETDGWVTSVVDNTGEAVYDVVAMGAESDDRLLLWTVDAASGPVDRTVLEQCETTAENSGQTDGAVVVTTASVTASAESAADAAGVSIVGLDALSDRLSTGDLAGAVLPQESGESPQT